MQMLLKSSVFRTQQVTKTPCATAIAARARARAASAGHIRGPLMNYKNDDDYMKGGQVGVYIARRGTRLFLCFFFPKKFLFRTQTAELSTGCVRIRLSTYPFYFISIFSPRKGGSSSRGQNWRKHALLGLKATKYGLFSTQTSLQGKRDKYR
jgi:hypothetical protein